MRAVMVMVAVISVALAVLVGAAPLATATDPPGLTQLVDVSTPTAAAKARLQGLGLDLTEHGDRNSIEVVLYGDADARRLRDAGFTYTVRIADMAARAEANRKADARYAAATTTSPLPSGRDTYRRLADYESELAALVRDYPSLAKPLALNHRTWEGRLVRGIEITANPNAKDGKPVFLIVGAHHAREWPSAELTMEFAYDLLRGYGRDSRTTNLVNAVRTIVVPVVNPDGFNVSREARAGAPSQDFSQHDFEMKRKNCRDAAFTCDRNTRLSGVDLNRNYGGLWGGGGASPNALSDVYRGPGPFSEPESQNLRELISSRQVVTLITNHTFSNLILRPPGTLAQGFGLDEPQLKALGATMAGHNGYENIPGFGLYDTTGTTEDWSFWSTGGLGYTFEIGGEDFHPPFQSGVVAEYLGLAPAAGAGKGGNREAYFEMMKATANKSLHSVLTGSAPAGSKLNLYKTFETATSPVCRDSFCSDVGPEQFFQDTLDTQMVTSAKTFTWHINPSTRPIVAGRYGRDPVAPAQATVPMVNDPAVVPDENIYYPSPAPRLAVPYETFTFDVAGPPAADNARFNVHIEWADAANDWDVYVLDSNSKIAAQSAAFGDATEDAVLIDPPPGRYTAVIVNYDQVQRTLDDWRGEVRFTSPTPTTYGPKESWTLRCETPAGAVVTRSTIVDRGQTLDVGNACGRVK
jgi:hypothetical protein